jgi:hypothetical protein
MNGKFVATFEGRHFFTASGDMNRFDMLHMRIDGFAVRHDELQRPVFHVFQ